METNKIHQGECEMKKLRLNLGCGNALRKDHLNVDVEKAPGVDKVWNLNKLPYPFKEDSVDGILMDAILEHLDNPYDVMREIWRICKPGAKIFITVPHFSSFQTWSDLTHKRAFAHSSLSCFRPKKANKQSSLINYQKEKFEVDARIKFGKIKRALGFEFFFNLNGFAKGFYEKHIAYIFPADKIYYNLVAIKGK
jgi:predicted SAM-dependent methyltransferase